MVKALDEAWGDYGVDLNDINPLEVEKVQNYFAIALGMISEGINYLENIQEDINELIVKNKLYTNILGDLEANVRDLNSVMDNINYVEISLAEVLELGDKHFSSGGEE